MSLGAGLTIVLTAVYGIGLYTAFEFLIAIVRELVRARRVQVWLMLALAISLVVIYTLLLSALVYLAIGLITG